LALQAVSLIELIKTGLDKLLVKQLRIVDLGEGADMALFQKKKGADMAWVIISRHMGVWCTTKIVSARCPKKKHAHQTD
jgi:hypothetical protein